MAASPSPRWSSVGKKVLIAITGFGLIGFLVVHLLGNLTIILGSPETFNAYSETLTANKFFLYTAEFGLIALFLLHLGTATVNYFANRSARGPQAYKVKKWAGHTSRKSVASTTMIVTGSVTLVFVVLHVITFKYGAWYETEAGIRDIYRLVIEVFNKPLVVVWYVVALALLGFHLWHGFSSAFQSVGAGTPGWARWTRRIGWVVAAVLALGFISIPVAVILGVGEGQAPAAHAQVEHTAGTQHSH